VKPWKTDGVEGVHRFLNRVWRLFVGPEGEVAPEIDDTPLSREQERLLHATIKKVGEDTDHLAFNTAISQMMIFVNEFARCEHRHRQAMESFVKLLSPYAPHLAEELWSRLGHGQSLAHESWPAWEAEKLKVDEVEILVQILGKPKTRLMMPSGADAKQMESLALADAGVQSGLAGKTVVKVIAVPGRLVNIVVR